jgi:hypothetical protein
MAGKISNGEANLSQRYRATVTMGGWPSKQSGRPKYRTRTATLESPDQLLSAATYWMEWSRVFFTLLFLSERQVHSWLALTGMVRPAGYVCAVPSESSEKSRYVSARSISVEPKTIRGGPACQYAGNS